MTAFFESKDDAVARNFSKNTYLFNIKDSSPVNSIDSLVISVM